MYDGETSQIRKYRRWIHQSKIAVLCCVFLFCYFRLDGHVDVWLNCSVRREARGARRKIWCCRCRWRLIMTATVGWYNNFSEPPSPLLLLLLSSFCCIVWQCVVQHIVVAPAEGLSNRIVCRLLLWLTGKATVVSEGSSSVHCHYNNSILVVTSSTSSYVLSRQYWRRLNGDRTTSSLLKCVVQHIVVAQLRVFPIESFVALLLWLTGKATVVSEGSSSVHCHYNNSILVVTSSTSSYVLSRQYWRRLDGDRTTSSLLKQVLVVTRWL
jgi:hypothetical protein